MKSELDKCDYLLKAGDVSGATLIIRSLQPRSISRPNRLRLARLCRRARLFEDGLKILGQTVRGGLEKPTNQEAAEYAVLLAWNGSHSEALQILTSINPDEVPEIRLHRAFCHILQWNYGMAAEELTFVVTTETDDYKRLVARVNLASAYLNNGDIEKAEELATANVDLARELKAQRLLGNSLEVRSQIWLRLQSFERCHADLDAAAQVLSGSTWDTSFIQKWRSIARAMETQNPDPIVEFRSTAVSSRQVESVRDADFYWLKVAFDRNRFDHLYIGTPHLSYRRRMCIEFSISPPEGFYLGGRNNPALHADTGDSPTITNPGMKLSRLIQILTRDFYAGTRLGEIFAHLYPGEHFDINSSPGRVRQIISRARKWMQDQGTGFDIWFSEGTYHLTVSGPMSVYVPNTSWIKDEVDAHLQRLTTKIPRLEFSSTEAAEALGISRPQFTRYARALVDRGRLERSGSGKYVRYKILPKAG